MLFTIATMLAATSPTHVALLPLEVEGLAVNEIRRIDGVVRGRAVARTDLDVLSEETTNALVDSSQTLGLTCHLPDTACAVQLGKLAAVDVVVAGGARRMKEGVSVVLATIDVRSGTATKTVQGLVAVDPTMQVKQMTALLAGLFGDGALGALKLTVTPASAATELDARVPAASTVEGLLPGAHVVDVAAKGYYPQHLEIVIAAGAPTSSTVALTQIPPPPPPPPPSFVDAYGPWIVVGAGAAVAIAGGAVAAVSSQSYFAAVKDDATLSGLKPNESVTDVVAAQAAAEKDRAAWNSTGIYAVPAGAAGLAVGVGAVVAGLLWRGAE